jgi:ATP-dependent Clp protease ATP-binding subunit ClpA
MLGLIGEGSGMAAQVLESLGISLEAARWLVEEAIGRAGQAPSGQPRFTPRAKKVLELASGLSPGYDHTCTWHILLALLLEGDGVGAHVLFTLGADQYRVGLRVNQLLNRDCGKEAPGTDSRPGERAYARLLDNPLARIGALDHRLAAVEHRLGLQPDLGDLNQQTVTVPRETAAAVDMQEFETATGLRGPETQRPAPRSPRQQRLERPLMAVRRWPGSRAGCTPSWTSCGRYCASTASTRAMTLHRRRAMDVR